MISRQMMRIYRVLSKTEYRTANDMAKELGVSSKTVRNQIKGLSKLLHDFGCDVETKHAVGYRLTVNNAEKLQELEKMMQGYVYQRSAIPNSSTERIQYLLEYLLNIDGYVKLDDLSGQLYISTRTLSENLKKVERMLGEYDLHLQRKPGYGIRIKGAEFNRRLCIAQYTAKRIEVLERTGIQVEITDEIQWIYQCVKQCFFENNFDMSALASMNLVIHIQIAILRMQQGHFVPEAECGTEKSLNSKAEQIAEEILREVSKEFHVEYQNSEAKYIAAHLEGKEMVGNSTRLKEGRENFVISQEISDLADDMLSSVYNTFQFDFRCNLELKMLLCQHLVPLVARLRHNMRLYNPCIDEIKAQYLLSYSMAATACAVLNQKYQTILKEDEIGYIALLFELALDREKTAIKKKNILLVSFSGNSGAQLFIHKYRKEFGPYVNQIRVCDVGHIEEVDFSDIDYVFTNTPIPVVIPVPIQRMTCFPTRSDIQTAKLTLQKSDSMLLDIYQEKLFLPHKKFCTKNEALQILCRYMCELELAPQELIDSDQIVENFATISHSSMAAVVTPIHLTADHSFACVAVLDDPIIWSPGGPDSLVQLIILLSVANHEQFDIQKFYEVTSRLVRDSANVQELIHSQSYDTLRDLLVRLEDQVEYDGLF